ncbi:MAG: UvrD-helicase domain-containing protein [Bacteroidetes bacterium]|nr:UvrD-helicase domain-containing protein [Bacteroidota bacterium]
MLRIYKASAGSGKTYTLVKEYLRLALKSPLQFRHILAITFTNKAAAEMKTRIIEALEGLSKNEIKYKSLNKELGELTGKSENELKSDASNILRNMLHNYADISVCTIDSFVHRIVRSFAYDLHLPMNFEIEMDSKELLNEAIQLLLDRLNETDQQVTQAVLEFAESKIEDGKSWNVEKEISKLGKQLFVDKAQSKIQQLSFVSFDDLREVHNSLYAFKISFEQQVFAEGKKAFDFIVTNGLTAKDFHYGNTGLFGFFKAYAESEFPPKILGNSYVNATINEDKWSKTSSITETQKAQLNVHYNNIAQLWNKQGKDYFLADLLLKNFYSFILLTDLKKLMDEVKTENNILHISDFQHKVFEIVKEQDAPIIYERIGDRYDNILIDEFQDTSVIQWRNLLPLIENSQFKSEDSLVVGDGKQAIYRFRGGEVEQFSVLPKVYGSDGDEILKGREVAINNYGAGVITLENNFRSRKEIVDFNNLLYKELLELPELKNKNIYADYFQKQGRKDDGGFVSIEFLKEEEAELSLNDVRALRVEEIVNDVLQRGYHYKEVAVLTRSNKNASFIASYLVSKGIKVVSPESLLIHHSPKVHFLLAILSYLNRKDNHISRAEILHFAFLLLNKELHLETIDLKTSALEFEEYVRKQTGLEFNSNELVTGRLSDLLYQLIQIFQLENDDPFVQFFLDEVLLFASRYGNSIDDFLNWWEKVKDKKSIIYPDSMDAVRIMTIHKSKGLEFPIVILADASEKQKPGEDSFWIDLNKNWLPQLPIGLLPNTKDVLETEFALLYEKEIEKTFLDLLNLLYVATTRAEDALYILSKEEDKEPISNNSVTAILISFLKSTGLWEGYRNYNFGDEEFVKIFGNGNNTSLASFEKGKTNSKNLLASNIKIRMRADLLWNDKSKEKINEGNLLHEALKRIQKTGDEETVLRSLLAEGVIEENEVQHLSDQLHSVLQHADLKKYFDGTSTVLNERQLLKKNEKIRIPDRVILFEDGATVLDYKSGNERPEYQQQLRDYAQWLEEAGIKVKEKILFYTQSQKAVVVK